jgi:hypothetical protein
MRHFCRLSASAACFGATAPKRSEGGKTALRLTGAMRMQRRVCTLLACFPAAFPPQSIPPWKQLRPRPRRSPGFARPGGLAGVGLCSQFPRPSLSLLRPCSPFPNPRARNLSGSPPPESSRPAGRYRCMGSEETSVVSSRSSATKQSRWRTVAVRSASMRSGPHSPVSDWNH